MTSIADHLNFTVDLKTVNTGLVSANGSKTGLVSANGSKTEYLKMLLNDEVDFIMNSPLHYLDLGVKPSIVLYILELLWIIPPGAPYSSLDKILYPFDTTVWICCWLVFLFVVIVIFVLRFSSKEKRNFILGRNVRGPYLNFLSIILGVTVVQVPGRNFARTMLMIFILYALIIRTAYQGGLFTALQMDLRKPAPKTMSEMIDKDFKFYVEYAWISKVRFLEKSRER